MMTGISLIHVPYRGSAPALSDLIGGQVQVMFDPVASSIGYLSEGSGVIDYLIEEDFVLVTKFYKLPCRDP
jgi:hypothetical protein